MPLFTTLITPVRPGNRARARARPSGIPASTLIPVAMPLTARDRSTISHTWASPPDNSRTACTSPFQIVSIARSGRRLVFGLPRIGHEKGLPVLCHAKLADQFLRRRVQQVVGKRLPARRVHLRPFL